MGLLSADALAQHSACFVGCAVCNVLERQTHTPDESGKTVDQRIVDLLHDQSVQNLLWLR